MNRFYKDTSMGKVLPKQIGKIEGSRSVILYSNYSRMKHHLLNTGKVFITLLCIAISTPLLAQEKMTDGGSYQLLDSISLKYKNFSTMQVDFSLIAEYEGKTTSSQKGKLLVKGSKLSLTFGDQQFCSDGKTLWNYQKASHEISIFSQEDSDDDLILNPLKLIENWKSKFRAKWIREEFHDGQMQILVDLTPIKEESYYRIRLFINEKTGEFTRFIVYEKDNTIYYYTFDKFVTNRPLDDQLFTLNPADYPDAEINDMR